jgi:hypothetical protein
LCSNNKVSFKAEFTKSVVPLFLFCTISRKRAYRIFLLG